MAMVPPSCAGGGAALPKPSRLFLSCCATRRLAPGWCNHFSAKGPACSPGTGSYPAPGIRLLYSAGNPAERVAETGCETTSAGFAKTVNTLLSSLLTCTRGAPML